MGVALSELARAERRRDETSLVPTRAKLDAFCQALGDATGLKISAYAAPRYDRLLRRLRLGEVELAWLPPVVALGAIPKDASPIVLPIRGDQSWFWAALFTRADSQVQSVDDLSQARAVWVDADSASGYLVIRAALRADGINPDTVFAKQTFAQSHDAMVRAVEEDPLCVGSTYVHLDAAGNMARAGWGDADVRVLRRAGPIPADILAASNDLSQETRSRVEDALVASAGPELKSASNALFFASHFARAETTHLAHLEVLGRYLLRERVR